MYDYDSDDESTHESHWIRTLAMGATFGLAAYVLYKLMSEPELVREGAKKVRRAAHKAGRKAEEVGEYVADKAEEVPDWAESTT